MKKLKIVVAPHDDGFGAFETCIKVVIALTSLAQKDYGLDLHITFLHSTAAKSGQSELEGAVKGATVRYIEVDNLIKLPKKKGMVNAAELPDVVEKVRKFKSKWPIDTQKRPVNIDWKGLSLAISMGVPWIHQRAQDAGIPSIEIGDMCFSIVIPGCFEEAGLSISSKDKKSLEEIAECERKANVACMLPYMSPREEYEDHFTSADVPVIWGKGVLWSGEPIPAGFDPRTWKYRNRIHKALLDDLSLYKNEDNTKVVRLEGGKTSVWEEIFNDLKKRPLESTRPAVITLKGAEVILLEQGGIRLDESTAEFNRQRKDKSRSFASRALYAAVDLGISRGGSSTLGFVAGRTPVAVTEEPFHWLSKRQRQELDKDDLCIQIKLDELQQNPDKLIEKLLGDSQFEQMRRRMYEIPIGAEHNLAEYIFNQYLIPRHSVGLS